MKNTTRFPIVSVLLVVVAALANSSCGTFVCNPISGSTEVTGSPVARGGNGNKPAQAHPLFSPAATQATCSTGGGNNGSCSSTDTPTQVLYTVDSTGAILAYGIGSDGSLTLLCATAKAALGELAVSNNKFLYVLNETPVAPSTQASILGFIIGHGNTGTVTSNGQSFAFGKAGETFDNLTNMEADPTGHLLFVTNYTAGLIHVFLINQGAGTLTEAVGSPVNIVPNPDFLAVSLTGRFAYVPDDVAGQIHVFSLNAATGAMTETANSPFTDDGGVANPGRFIAFHPGGNFVYTSDVSSISAYTVNNNTGDLGGVAGSPFDTPNIIPEFFAIDSTSKFLYVIDGSSNQLGIEGFTIDSTGTGALQGQVPNSPFALKNTFSIVSNPSGPEVYVQGGATANNLINIFAITPATGTLTPPASSTLIAASNLVISNVQ